MLKILFHLLLTVVVISQATPLLKTGQTLSYDIEGHIISDGSIKDDGYYQKGTNRSYSRSDAGVVMDNATGLEWQDNENVVDTWSNAVSYCSTLTLDGGEWRLPSIEELESIVDYGNDNPSLPEGVFQHITYPSYRTYWSSSEYPSDNRYMWYANFSNGSLSYTPTDEIYDAGFLCVRGEQFDEANLSRSGNSVTDNNTKLQWQDDEVVATKRTLTKSIEYCETLTLDGHDDWRLPNIKELLSIFDSSLYEPAIDTNTFVNIPLSDSYLWSSTTYSYDSTYGWVVHSNYGYSNASGKRNIYPSRCVRGGVFDGLNPSIIIYLIN